MLPRLSREKPAATILLASDGLDLLSTANRPKCHRSYSLQENLKEAASRGYHARSFSVGLGRVTKLTLREWAGSNVWGGQDL